MILGLAGIDQGGLECLDRLRQRRNILADARQDVARDVQRPAFLLDFVQRRDLGAVLDILESAVPGDDLIAVLMVEKVLRPAFAEQAGSVDDQDLVLAGFGFVAAESDPISLDTELA